MAGKFFDEWQVAGEPTRQSWCLKSAGVFGGERVLQRLGGDVDTMYGERRYKVVDLVLGILSESAHPQGLIEVQRLSQRSKYKRVRDKCSFAIKRLASRKGWDMERFADKLIPTGGLDEHEEVIFDYGARSFALEILADGSLVVHDTETKERHKSLPRKRKSDDKAMVAQAKVDWSARKKQLGDVIKVQVERLRTALSTGRRWDTRGWEELLGHPVMKHLLCGLLWASYDRYNRLEACFRVASDQSLADIEDEEHALLHDKEGGRKIGLVHPLELDKKSLARWVALFGEYEIIQPFPQLGRSTFTLSDEEKKEQMLGRLKGLEIEDSGWFRGHLRRNHWKNQPIVQGGARVTGLQRSFPNHGITAYLHILPGFNPKTSKHDSVQSVNTLYFKDGDRRVLLGRVPSLVVSEVLHDLDPFVRAAEKNA